MRFLGTMMGMPRTHTTARRTILTLAPLALFVAVASFGAGMQTAGDLRTIEWSSATDAPRGDVNGDGTVDETDVIAILEIAQGYRTATPKELHADPNGDGKLAVDDAIRVLRTLSTR